MEYADLKNQRIEWEQRDPRPRKYSQGDSGPAKNHGESIDDAEDAGLLMEQLNNLKVFAPEPLKVGSNENDVSPLIGEKYLTKSNSPTLPVDKAGPPAEDSCIRS